MNIPAHQTLQSLSAVFRGSEGQPGLRRPPLSVWLVLVCGTIFALFVFLNLRFRDDRELEHEFQLTAGSYTASFKREMSGNVAVLQSLSAFAEVQPSLRRANFEPFARKQLEANPDLLGLEWLPRVEGAARQQVEKELSAAEHRPVEFTTGTPAEARRADGRPVYFPIALMYPRQAAGSVVGYDPYSQPRMEAALDRSRDTGQPLASTRLRLVENQGRDFAIPVFVPVYQGLADHATLPGRRADLAGYVLGLIDIENALERAIRQVSTGYVNIEFFDLSAAPGARLIHFHREAGESSTVAAAPEDLALTAAGMKSIRTFTFASRNWAMVCTPTAAYLRKSRSVQTWGVLVLGLVCTFTVAAYVSLSASYAHRAEGLVAQLYRINGHMNTEIQERKNAEEEVSRLNASLERRVNQRTEALRESDERYALAARGSKDGLWDWNLTTGRIYFSSRWKTMLGYSENEIDDRPNEWFRLMHPEEAPRVRSEISAHLAGDTPQFQSEHRMRHKDGAYRWMLSRGVAVRDERGNSTRMAGSQTDITEGKVADALTGLPNRVFLADKLQHAIERAHASRNGSFAVLFMDLDRFKIVNDSLGHKAGDQLLRFIASRLLETAAAAALPTHTITVARLGGDEFAVLLGQISSQKDATGFAAAIQSAMKPAFNLEGRPIFVACSVGVAFGNGDSEANEIVRDADTAMYFAKSNGKQRYEIFDAAMRQRSIERLQLETDLRAAISRNELTVHYQPKVSLTTGQVVEFEALVRWTHPERGMVTPQDFIPLADETGLIFPIGEWVLETACRQAMDWKRRFGSAAGVSVNVSVRQFETFDLMPKVRAVLATTGLPASLLSLEVTESLLLENPESAIQQLGQLRDLGINLKIDDFGTGFSSLSYLHRLPFHELKIDRSFVSGMDKAREAGHIIRTIIMLARVLGMSVVAEGVETEEQLLQLAALSCDHAQGNYFSKAVPAEVAEQFLGPARHSLLPDSLVFPAQAKTLGSARVQ